MIATTLDKVFNEPNVIGYYCTLNYRKVLRDISIYFRDNNITITYPNRSKVMLKHDYELKPNFKNRTYGLYIDSKLKVVIKPLLTSPNNTNSIA